MDKLPYNLQLIIEETAVQPQAQQTKVGENSLRTKRGPYSKPSKTVRRDKIRQLYFEEGYSIKDAAKTLGIHRNTATADVKFWIKKFERLGVGAVITDFFYKQKSLLEAQKFRLLKKLKAASDFNTQYKLEKLLFSLYDREMKFYLKFKPNALEYPQANTKLVKQIIRELALDDFSFFWQKELLREIIRKTKCNVFTANSIIQEMENLGLKYTGTMGSEIISLFEFAELCGYLSAEEISTKNQEKAQRKEQAEREYLKKLTVYEKEFMEKFGTSKFWSDEVKEKYKNGLPPKY